MKTNTCYACDEVATSVEHVPPKCIFPEAKDLPAGVGLRDSLITVPSCDEHNTARSKDDEYLMHALCLSIANNTTALEHFRTKILRSAERRPALMMSFLNNHIPVNAIDDSTLTREQKTIAVKVEMGRVYKCAASIARGLLYHETKNKFRGKFAVVDDFTVDPQVPASAEHEEKIRSLREHFRSQQWIGKNPEVFRYQHYREKATKNYMIAMEFYGATHLYVVLLADDEAWSKRTPNKAMKL